MTRVAGPSLDQLDRLGDDYAGLVAESLATVAVWTPDVENLVVIRADWADTVDALLLPALGVAFEVGAATIRVGLREATGLTAAAFTDVRPTSDALAEQYLAAARNRLVGVGDELWSHAREELLEGLQAGEGVPELAARVRKAAPDLTEPRAEAIARSEVMGAVNAGALEQVLASGATGTKQWLCVAGRVPVVAPNVLQAARRWYVGPLVVVKTASGREVSLTPNHEVLTERGWVQAQGLGDRDKLVQVVGVEPVGAPGVDEAPALIGQVVDALFQRAPVEQVRTMPAGVDLKPDRDSRAATSGGGFGVLQEGQVEVVLADAVLAHDLEPRAEAVSDLALQATDECLGVLFGGGSSRQGGRGEGAPSALLHADHHALALHLGALAGDPDVRGGTLVSDRHTGLDDMAPDGCWAGAEGPAEGVEAFPGLVALDDLVSVEVIPWSGHVYDLSTVQSWYVADGIIVHNSADDDRTRHAHDLADNDTVGLAEHFTVGGFPMLRPHDPAGPPHLTVNCRCALSFDLDIPEPEPVTVGEVVESAPEESDRTTSQQRDRSFLARVVADGLAALVGWFKARTAAAMIPEQEFEGRKVSGPPGGQLFPGWDPSAHSLTESLETNMPGQMSPAQGAVGDPRRFSIPQRGDEMTDASQPVEHFHYRMAEGVSTGLRTFASGAITWREPPFAFMWQKMIPESGGHGLAVQAGLITRAERSGKQIDFYGPLDLNSDDGLEYARRLVEGFARWGSVSPDENKVDVEVVWADGISEEDMALGAKPEQYVFRSFNVAELTALSVPALADATIEPTPALLEELERRGALPEGVKMPRSDPETVVAAASLDDHRPPAEFFTRCTDPILTVTTPDGRTFQPALGARNGRVWGYAAHWKDCHIGYPGVCTSPPQEDDFAHYMVGEVLCAGGERVPVGQITINTGHASTVQAARTAAEHYDHTGAAVADVVVGADDLGIWFSGALRPGADEAALRAAGSVSGDWRRINGSLRLVAVLAVNVAGFQQVRARVASGVQTALVAAGQVVREEITEPDLSKVKQRVARSIGRDPKSRKVAAAARVKARG